jgi:hypothetical protein
VSGNVTVGQGATFVMVGGTIAGNVQGNNCGTVALDSVTVGTNVQIGNCRGSAAFPFGGIVELSTIGGDFQCHNNTVAQIPCALIFSQVIGNAQVMNNVSSSGAIEIAGNAISKNLECQEQQSGANQAWHSQHFEPLDALGSHDERSEAGALSERLRGAVLQRDRPGHTHCRISER